MAWNNNEWWRERWRDYKQDPAVIQVVGLLAVLLTAMIVAVVWVLPRLQPDYSESFEHQVDLRDAANPSANAPVEAEEEIIVEADLRNQAYSLVERRRAMQRLVERTYQAAGGKINLEGMKSISKTGDLEQKGTSMPVVYQYKRPSNLRYTIELKQGMLRMAYNGEVAWRQLESPTSGPREVEILSEEERRLLAGNTLLAQPVSAFLENWDDLHWEDSASVDGHPCYVIRYEGLLWPTQRFFIDKQTFQVRRRERHHQTDDGKDVVLGIVLDDFREVDQLILPFREEVWLDDVKQNVFVITEIEINRGLSSRFFDPPSIVSTTEPANAAR